MTDVRRTPTADLNSRFQKFVRTLPGVESIDELAPPLGPPNAKKADYFLDGRQVVVELKASHVEMGEKVQTIIEGWRAKGEFPSWYGSASIEPFLRRHPRGTVLRSHLLDAVATPLEREFASANRQIRSTKANFGVPAAGGLLVYLNDLTEVLAPDVAVHRFTHLLRKRHPDGRRRFECVDAVLIISETHVLEASPQLEARPMIFLVREDLEVRSPVSLAGDRLMKAWAAYCRSPLVHATLESLEQISTAQVPLSQKADEALTQIRRHEAWRRDYRANPYLRTRSDTELLSLGRDVMHDLACHLLKGSRRRLTQKQMQSTIITFTHFMEELNARGIGAEEFQRSMDRTFWSRVESESGVSRTAVSEGEREP